MALAGSAIAADGDVIPNFTALKIGEVSGTPSTGGIRAQGVIQAGTGLKASRLIPTSSTISVLGSLDVQDDLTADSFGYYYTVSEYCNDDAAAITNCDAYTYASDWNQLEAACYTGDTVVSCEGWPMGADDIATYQSWANNSDSCVTISDAPGIQTQAICFSPDGEPAEDTTFSLVSMTADLMPSSFSDSVDAYMTTNYSHMATAAALDTYIDNMIDDYVDEQIDSILSSKGYLKDTDMDNWLDSNDYATQTWVGDQSYATESWVSSSYATKSYVDTNFTPAGFR